MHDRRDGHHAGLRSQPSRGQIPSRSSTLPAAAHCAISTATPVRHRRYGVPRPLCLLKTDLAPSSARVNSGLSHVTPIQMGPTGLRGRDVFLNSSMRSRRRIFQDVAPSSGRLLSNLGETVGLGEIADRRRAAVPGPQVRDLQPKPSKLTDGRLIYVTALRILPGGLQRSVE
jgi:hypothetical protein